MAQSPPTPNVVVGFGPRWFRIALGVLAALFLLCMLLGVLRSPRQRWFPRPFRFFTQIACLFPYAKRANLDYRVLAYSCDAKRYAELDVRPFFPVNREHKENRFHRAIYFYRRHRRVLQSVEKYLVARYRELLLRTGGAPGTSEVRGPIGGVLITKVRQSLPPVGSRMPRYRRLRLRDYPRSSIWTVYRTPKSLIRQRCREVRR
ncbi:MAG: hypothetical protein KC609_15010 [Myxococcales bacterium]|nr:hypothetical protein [Myxococcales bacterium]